MKQLFLMEWGCEQMSKILVEENLCFDFTSCPVVADPVKFDAKLPHGMMGVDFIAETEDIQYLIEIKDFQNPKTPKEMQRENYEMLIAATKTKIDKTKDKYGDDLTFAKGTIFCLKIGQKLRDTIISKYAKGEGFTKRIVFIVVINLENLTNAERGNLKTKINGYIPIGLNDCNFTNFTNISFDLVNAEQLKTYGIICTPMSQ